MLSERGLEPAVRALAARAPVPVDIVGDAAGRLPAAVETAAYFVVSEALTNVSKYAQAEHATVRVERVGRTSAGRGQRRRRGRRQRAATAPDCEAWPIASRRSAARSRSRALRARAHDCGPSCPARERRGATSPLRVVVAEDSFLLRAGVVRVLEANGFVVVGEASDAEELLAQVREHRPDVVVTDIRMPPTHTDEGLRAAAIIRSERPSTGVVVLSQFVKESYALQLLEESAAGVGYLLKDRVMEPRAFAECRPAGRARRLRARSRGRRPDARAPPRRAARSTS